MKFTITRASDWDILFSKKPCEEAKKEQVVVHEHYSYKTFEEYNKARPKEPKFTETGFNHRITSIGIARDAKDDYWVVEFESLDELNAFIESYGDIVIKNKTFDCEYNQIIIYDDYIE